jgi:pimeloyl-ACP methyl ester carboxylesterase
MRDLRITLPSGVTLHVRSDGEPGGTDFLLIHGLASNARLWDETAAVLVAAGHRTFAVDLRGHGDSDLPDGDIGTGTAAHDVAAIADHLGVTGAVVAGQSWGGNVAVRLAAQRPDLVRALALVDGGWIDLAAEFGSWDDCAAALRPGDVDGMPATQLADYLRNAHPGWSDAAVAATTYNLLERSDGTVVRRLPIPRHLQIVRDMWENPPWADLARVSVPALLIPAISSDPSRAGQTHTRVQAAAKALGHHAHIREYPDGDHDLHAQHPKELAEDLLSLVADR